MYEFLKQIKFIAIVGLSPDESKDSNMVGRYLAKKGYFLYPIYPAGDEILGFKAYRSLDEINDQIDMVVMFRKGVYAEKLINSVIAKSVKHFWLQLGITNEIAKQKAIANGINFIEDKCVKIELEKLYDE
ncbi:MAG: CoA-binding protein [Campylobacter sp.]|nr:CoA-binding protein [Campylobacter sp.]